MAIIKKECPDCGGSMFRSRGKIIFHNWIWKQPWKLPLIWRIPDVYSWLCLDCGQLSLNVDEKDLKYLKAEYEKQAPRTREAV